MWIRRKEGHHRALGATFSASRAVEVSAVLRDWEKNRVVSLLQGPSMADSDKNGADAAYGFLVGMRFAPEPSQTVAGGHMFSLAMRGVDLV